MIDRLNASLNFYQQALNLRDERQKVLSANIANADTPGYQARDFDFRSELDQAVKRGGSTEGNGGLAMATTSSRHIPGQAPGNGSVSNLMYRVPSQPSLDGNTVDMDMERVNFADNAVHYQADLQFITSRLQGLKQAMQPE
ncbi:flagellar basal body rod protein FlgB [Kushneria phosphatilytica]|uniref:Flagellar basal body rod protein FlgB n=1 Tax=Kushneria phosphatilytica TaxID=657387 RepID=A0A1S1P0L5_9GAMM|nr:flagellar basal body rod protein FlgB [Kushneria phosphatilytica]OHV12025.1 flagellar basal body rod protein FlgB [Kushneria phosphatilytica]QEL11218.1 flagellar basal body rod protein FlgB [Kushneria phosphatilytica]